MKNKEIKDKVTEEGRVRRLDITIFPVRSLGQIPQALNELNDKIIEIEKHIKSFNPLPQSNGINDEFLTRLQVKDILKISYPTLREWTKAGKIKAYRIGGGNSIRYKSSELAEILLKIKPNNI